MKVNGKMEALLNLALNVGEEERRKSAALGIGYDAAEGTWELIVKYNGHIGRLRESGMQVEELITGYAIVKIKEQLIDVFTELDEVEYVEKPKRLYFSSIEDIENIENIENIEEKNPFDAPTVSLRPPQLSGAGTLIGIIDSGLDYQGMEFRNSDGSSRVLYLWDQSLTVEGVNRLTPKDSPFAEMARPPEGFKTGVEFNKARIDVALEAPTEAETFQLVPSRDAAGHGTAVTAIAAATGVLEESRYIGMAPKCNLIIVKLGDSGPDVFPKTTELMRALTYVVKKAVSLGMPIAVNLSFGHTEGSHDGTSLLERFIDQLSEIGKNVICVGMGNEGAACGHATGKFGQITGGSKPAKRIELNIARYQQSLGVQLWKEYADQYEFVLIAPSGRQEVIDMAAPGAKTVILDQTQVLILVGEPSPYTINQEIYFDFIPEENYVNQGVWIFSITPVKTVNGNYDLYLPGSEGLVAGTGFFAPAPEMTLTIPSTASKVIAVGAYDMIYGSYADFSGRGCIVQSPPESRIAGGTTKPDLEAPGVNIPTVLPGNEVGVVSGTSFATPFVTGAAALLMEWGVVMGNDGYLYGAKVLAYLRGEVRGR